MLLVFSVHKLNAFFLLLQCFLVLRIEEVNVFMTHLQLLLLLKQLLGQMGQLLLLTAFGGLKIWNQLLSKFFALGILSCLWILTAVLMLLTEAKVRLRNLVVQHGFIWVLWRAQLVLFEDASLLAQV